MMDRHTAKVFKSLAEQALSELAVSYGASVSLSTPLRAKDQSGVYFRFKVCMSGDAVVATQAKAGDKVVPCYNSAGLVMTAQMLEDERSAFGNGCWALGLEPSDYGKAFDVNGRQYRVTGRRRGRKYTVIGRRLSTGKLYRFSRSVIPSIRAAAPAPEQPFVAVAAPIVPSPPIGINRPQASAAKPGRMLTADYLPDEPDIEV